MNELKSKSVKQLRDMCYRLQIATLNPASKWYQEDCKGIKLALSRKNKQQVIETISRYTWQPSEKMMRDHCQFSGLFTDTAGYR